MILKQFCEVDDSTISIKDVVNKGNVQMIDVRETHELPKIKGLEVTSIPLSTLESQLKKINHEKKKAIFCQSGIRSKRAVSILKAFKMDHCYSIIEGALEIKLYLEEQHKEVSNGK